MLSIMSDTMNRKLIKRCICFNFPSRFIRENNKNDGTKINDFKRPNVCKTNSLFKLLNCIAAKTLPCDILKKATCALFNKLLHFSCHGIFIFSTQEFPMRQ